MAISSGSSLSYIQILDSSGSGGKFSIVFGGYEPDLVKDNLVNHEVNGGLDVSTGGVYPETIYNIKCYDVETRSGYGNYNELRRLFSLNNPNGTPSNRLTIKDHWNVTKYGYLVDRLPPRAATVYIGGSEAQYFVQVKVVLEP